MQNYQICILELLQVVDFSKDAPRKGESETALQNNNYPTKSGSEHVQESLFKQADERNY